jgi:hypothetical protein
MIRILFNDYNNAHSDIILKIDAMPAFLQETNTYFLSDFLGRLQRTRKEVIRNYLEYFKERVQRILEALCGE